MESPQDSFIWWREGGHKYGYTNTEAFMMVLVTAITNFACVPAMILLVKKNLIFQAYIGLFTFITSFMYHFVESIGAEKIFMNEGEWHQLGNIFHLIFYLLFGRPFTCRELRENLMFYLCNTYNFIDNIGAIMCFISVFIHMANFQNYELEMHLNYSALILTIILQIADPWNLSFTVGPIALFILITVFLGFKLKTKPFTNSEMTRKGFFCIFLGAIFFSLSQDEHKDYLRIYHGLWHSVIGYSAMYTWQSYEKVGDEIYLADILSKPAKYIALVYEKKLHI